MLIPIGHANVDSIAKTLEYLLIGSMTTNPTILYREGKELLRILYAIKSVLPDSTQLHAQITSQRTDDMVAEARTLHGEINSNLFVRLPITREGFAAIPRAVCEDVQVVVTGIHSSIQGPMAAGAGARYIAPCVNRMDNCGINGVRVASEIRHTLCFYDLKTGVLAVSSENPKQVLKLVRQDVGVIITASDMLTAFIKNPVTGATIADQNRDSGFLVGKHHTWLDLIEEK